MVLIYPASMRFIECPWIPSRARGYPSIERCSGHKHLNVDLVFYAGLVERGIASEVDAAFYESCVKNQIDVEVFVPTAALD